MRPCISVNGVRGEPVFLAADLVESTVGAEGLSQLRLLHAQRMVADDNLRSREFLEDQLRQLAASNSKLQMENDYRSLGRELGTVPPHPLLAPAEKVVLIHRNTVVESVQRNQLHPEGSPPTKRPTTGPTEKLSHGASEKPTLPCRGSSPSLSRPLECSATVGGYSMKRFEVAKDVVQGSILKTKTPTNPIQRPQDDVKAPPWAQNFMMGFVVPPLQSTSILKHQVEELQKIHDSLPRSSSTVAGRSSAELLDALLPTVGTPEKETTPPTRSCDVRNDACCLNKRCCEKKAPRTQSHSRGRDGLRFGRQPISRRK